MSNHRRESSSLFSRTNQHNSLSVVLIFYFWLICFLDFKLNVGWAIPEEYTEIFADLVIVGAVLMVSCKYITEAFTKFRAILQVKGDTENE